MGAACCKASAVEDPLPAFTSVAGFNIDIPVEDAPPRPSRSQSGSVSTVGTPRDPKHHGARKMPPSVDDARRSSRASPRSPQSPASAKKSREATPLESPEAEPSPADPSRSGSLVSDEGDDSALPRFAERRDSLPGNPLNAPGAEAAKDKDKDAADGNDSSRESSNSSAATSGRRAFGVMRTRDPPGVRRSL